MISCDAAPNKSFVVRALFMNNTSKSSFYSNPPAVVQFGNVGYKYTFSAAPIFSIYSSLFWNFSAATMFLLFAVNVQYFKKFG